MVCSTFVLSVGAEELQIDTEIQSNVETCGDYEYEILEDGKSIAITKYLGDDVDVVVPSIINGYAVKIIRQLAFDGSIDWDGTGRARNTKMKSLTFSEGIEFLESYSVAWCNNLSKIILPSTFTFDLNLVQNKGLT